MGCHGKVKDIYKSKELWRGPESIYRKEGVLALSGDRRLDLILLISTFAISTIMAEAIGLAAGVIGIATLAYSSSKALYELLNRIRDTPRTVDFLEDRS